MSTSYYFKKDDTYRSKAKVKKVISHEKWVEVIESLPNITWDIDTKRGKYFFQKDPKNNFKSQVYFDYKENEENIDFQNTQVVTTGSYSMFISYRLSEGNARSQFYGRDNPNLIPTLFEIAQKLECNLFNDDGKLIDQKELDRMMTEVGKFNLVSEPVLEYSFGENSRWIAIKAKSQRQIIRAINCGKAKSVAWDEAFEKQDENDFIITPKINGWFFVTALHLEKVLEKESGISSALSFEDFIRQIEAFSNSFTEVQWYENSEKYNLAAFAQCKKGHMKYYYFSSEDRIEESGIKPGKIKKTDMSSIKEISQLMSADPTVFPFIESLKEAKVMKGNLTNSI